MSLGGDETLGNLRIPEVYTTNPAAYMRATELLAPFSPHGNVVGNAMGAETQAGFDAAWQILGEVAMERAANRAAAITSDPALSFASRILAERESNQTRAV